MLDYFLVVLESTLEEYKWIKKEDMESYEFHPNIKKAIQKVFAIV